MVRTRADFVVGDWKPMFTNNTCVWWGVKWVGTAQCSLFVYQHKSQFVNSVGMLSVRGGSEIYFGIQFRSSIEPQKWRLNDEIEGMYVTL